MIKAPEKSFHHSEWMEGWAPLWNSSRALSIAKCCSPGEKTAPKQWKQLLSAVSPACEKGNRVTNDEISRKDIGNTLGRVKAETLKEKAETLKEWQNHFSKS